MTFLCIVCTIFDVYFGKFVMTFVDIGEIGCTSILKSHWIVIVVNLVNKLDFLDDAACWCGFVHAGLVSDIPVSSSDNRHQASWHTCCKALQVIYMDFCPFIAKGLAEPTEILGWVVHTDDCTAQFIPNMFYGVAVWRPCRLLHLGDVDLLKEIKEFLSRERCCVIVLVALIIPEMLPGKWH